MGSYLNFFTHEEANSILTAIKDAEKKTSGEIRVHVEDYCNHLVFDRASQVFEKLKMNDTKERNGVLFYISVQDREFAVLGDIGIHEKVGEQYWAELSKEMEMAFRQSKFAKGLVQAIRNAGESLQTYFPIQPGDHNELKDDISVGNI